MSEMMIRSFGILATLTLAGVALYAAGTLQPVSAAEAASDEEARRAVAAALQVMPEDVKAAPIDGLYQAAVGPSVYYVSADGRFLIAGDVIDMQTNANLTEEARSQARLQALEGLGEDRMIVFEPEGEVETTMTVITDVTCGVCQRLHSERDAYLSRGVRIRYLLYNRTGPYGQGWEENRAVWCSADREAALTRAKNRQPVTSPDCDVSALMENLSFGRMLGMSGTPAIITESGQYIPGAYPLPRMLELLGIPDEG